MRALSIALCLVSVSAARVSGARAEEPQRVGPGERVRAEVEMPYGLTPPPGIQNERALRGFAARLCTPLRCLPLEAVNVRPRDGWSLVYRAEFGLPRALPAGQYDLEVRYPGGVSLRPGGVAVRSGPPAPEPPAPEPVRAHAGCGVASGSGGGAPLGLLLLALSGKLAAARRGRGRNQQPARE